uniref:helix-turn-helix domain-containing protein n=6 Tax=Thiolapillus sp. TaxID=2017437 RepID=UPI0025CE03F9
DFLSQTAQLIGALKRALKTQGKTYSDIARYLSLSEASVKRMFSKRHFSLRRLDQVCQMLGLEISDLVQMMNEQHARSLSELSLEQEREIVADVELLLIAVCVLNRWRFEQITAYFSMDHTRCYRLLNRLDRLKMIELLPGNRIKLLVAPNFKWRENGPIQQFFLQKLQSDFFASRFDQEHESLIVVNGMLADSSIAVFRRKLEQLAREFDALSDGDAELPFADRNGTTVILAMRQWRYGLFQQFVKGSGHT